MFIRSCSSYYSNVIHNYVENTQYELASHMKSPCKVLSITQVMRLSMTAGLKMGNCLGKVFANVQYESYILKLVIS